MAQRTNHFFQQYNLSDGSNRCAYKQALGFHVCRFCTGNKLMSLIDCYHLRCRGHCNPDITAILWRIRPMDQQTSQPDTLLNKYSDKGLRTYIIISVHVSMINKSWGKGLYLKISEVDVSDFLALLRSWNQKRSEWPRRKAKAPSAKEKRRKFANANPLKGYTLLGWNVLKGYLLPSCKYCKRAG